MLLAAFLIILVLNLGYGVRKIIDDLAVGRHAMAALGAVCLLGVNGIVFWLVYASLISSTDL